VPFAGGQRLTHVDGLGCIIEADLAIVALRWLSSSAMRGRRDVDRNGSIGMLGSEAGAPYLA
jgi:hypothetical protein